MTIASFFSDWPTWFGQLLPGLWASVQLTFWVLLFGFPLGLALATAIESGSAALRAGAIAIVEFGRGTPLLVLLYLVYFGLPEAHLTLDRFVSVVLALAFNAGAYSSEVFRSGLLAIPTGQREASRALGLSLARELRVVVLPQAVRIVVPPLISFAILVFQATSLAYTIGYSELLGRAYNIGTVSFKVLEVLVLMALMYAAVSLPVAQVVNLLERRTLRRT